MEARQTTGMSSPGEDRPATCALRKAIPAARDRLQSRLLVAVAVPMLGYLASQAVRCALSPGQAGRLFLAAAGTGSLLFALAAWRMRAATAAGAGCGGAICFVVTIFSARPGAGSIFRSGLSPLILLFVLTHASTRFRRRRGTDFDPDEERRGRNAAQVIANLGVAAIANAAWYSGFGGYHGPFTMAGSHLALLAALAEATADTVSSELGRAVGGMPYLMTALRRVPAGTDGAISAAGTLWGMAAAAAIALAGAPAMGMRGFDCAAVWLAGTGGMFFDSILGATLETRGWTGNDVVNFASTAFSAIALAVTCRWI